MSGLLPNTTAEEWHRDSYPQPPRIREATGIAAGGQIGPAPVESGSPCRHGAEGAILLPCNECGAKNPREPAAIHGMKGRGSALMALGCLIPIVGGLVAFVASQPGC